MGISGKDKGNRNETRAAELISKWTGKEFKKVPRGAGAFTQYSNPAQCDIVCVTEGHYFPFSVEVKAYKELDFSKLIRQPKTKSRKDRILEFWDQTVRVAEKAGKVPMLLMRYDRLPKDFFYMVLDYHYLGEVCYGELDVSMEPLLQYRNKKYLFVIIDSRKFFELPYKEIKKLTKLYGKKKR